jgi:hypothetical protein
LLPLFVNHLNSPSAAMIQNQIVDWYVVPLMACGVMLIPWPFRRIESTVFAVGTASILFVVVVIVSARTTMWKSFDFRPLAQTAASNTNGVAWYGLYEGQLNYLGGIRDVHAARGIDELSKWLSEHRNGIVIEELSAANVEALQTAGIEASNSNIASSSQLEQITQIVRADAEFPGHQWQPTISHLFWIRPRFQLRPYVVVRFENPPN